MEEQQNEEQRTNDEKTRKNTWNPPFFQSANPIFMLGRSLHFRKMFASLTRSKFYTKCNSLINITKERVEVSRKKKNAVAKYLKTDIADLLKTGFDINAYSRAQGLILEHNLIAAYKFVEDFCDCIATNLAILDKQKECPNECREAIQSLMYAAARFAEFPELRDLRFLFSHRYGDCLESYINKEFRELLNPRPATKEMKLQLLRDVAEEFSINWHPKFLEQKLFRPPHASQQNQNRNVGSNNPEDGDHKTRKSKDDAAPRSANNSGRRFKYKHQEDGNRESHGTSAENSLDTSEVEFTSPGRKNFNDEKHRLHSSSGSETTDRNSSEPSPSSMGTTSTSEDEVDNRKIPYRFLPPPYFRTRQDVKDRGPPKSTSPDTVESGSELQRKSRLVRRQQMKAVMGDENAGSAESPSDDGGEDEEQHKLKRAQYERNKMKSWRSRDPGSAPSFGSLGKTALAASTSSNSGTGRDARSLSADSKMSGHVHPNLPDYDSLAARIAAFMGK